MGDCQSDLKTANRRGRVPGFGERTITQDQPHATQSPGGILRTDRHNIRNPTTLTFLAISPLLLVVRIEPDDHVERIGIHARSPTREFARLTLSFSERLLLVAIDLAGPTPLCTLPPLWCTPPTSHHSFSEPRRGYPLRLRWLSSAPMAAQRLR